MLVPNVIMAILLNALDPIAAVKQALYFIGLWKLFQKSGVTPWHAFVPCLREYTLARSVGRERQGRELAVITFFQIVAQVITLCFDHTGNYETIALLSSVAVLVLVIISIVYRARIYMTLIAIYGKDRKWIVAWILLEGFVALLWGFSNRYQPSWTVADLGESQTPNVSGVKVDVANEGLTVNLEKRTAKDLFQTKCLLRDIHLTIQPGHMVLLLGGSGAGKTTLINAINGYEKADAEIVLNGQDMYRAYKQMQYEVGFVPQQELMRGKDTVYRTLADAALLRLPSEVTAEKREKRVRQVMDLFGLAPVERNLVEKLSGGQKKRLSIAMEFISNPSLFILDEPDSGLDGVMARELMEQLRAIANEGRIVIVITHTPDRVIDLFDDVIVLAKDADRTGRLTFYGSIKNARAFFGKQSMEQIVMAVNRPEEGGEGRADEFVRKYAEVQYA